MFARTFLIALCLALGIILAFLGLWGTARAAQQSAATPNLNIVGLNNNLVTLAGQNWEPNSPVRLSYSPSPSCQPATDLNDHQGTQTVAEGADAIVHLATLPPDGPTGTFQGRGGTTDPW